MPWQPWWSLWNLEWSWSESVRSDHRWLWRKGNGRWAVRAESHQLTTCRWLSYRKMRHGNSAHQSEWWLNEHVLFVWILVLRSCQSLHSCYCIIMYNSCNIMSSSHVWDTNLFPGWDTLWGLLALWSPGFPPWEPPAAFFISKNNIKLEKTQIKGRRTNTWNLLHDRVFSKLFIFCYLDKQMLHTRSVR